MTLVETDERAQLDNQLRELLMRSDICFDTITDTDVERISHLALHREISKQEGLERQERAISGLEGLADPAVTTNVEGITQAVTDYVNKHLSKEEQKMIGMIPPWYQQWCQRAADLLGSLNTRLLIWGGTLLLAASVGATYGYIDNMPVEQTLPLSSRPNIANTQLINNLVSDSSYLGSVCPIIQVENEDFRRTIGSATYSGTDREDPAEGRIVEATVFETMNRTYACRPWHTREIHLWDEGIIKDPAICARLKDISRIAVYGDSVHLLYRINVRGYHDTKEAEVIFDGDRSGHIGDSPLDMVFNTDLYGGFVTTTRACRDGQDVKFDDPNTGSELRKAYQARSERVLHEADARYNRVRSDVFKSLK